MPSTTSNVIIITNDELIFKCSRMINHQKFSWVIPELKGLIEAMIQNDPINIMYEHPSYPSYPLNSTNPNAIPFIDKVRIELIKNHPEYSIMTPNNEMYLHWFIEWSNEISLFFRFVNKNKSLLTFYITPTGMIEKHYNDI
jgi:hypothetical protein